MPIYYQIKSFIKHYLSNIFIRRIIQVILLNTDLTLIAAMVRKMDTNIGETSEKMLF